MKRYDQYSGKLNEEGNYINGKLDKPKKIRFEDEDSD